MIRWVNMRVLFNTHRICRNLNIMVLWSKTTHLLPVPIYVQIVCVCVCVCVCGGGGWCRPITFLIENNPLFFKYDINIVRY